MPVSFARTSRARTLVAMATAVVVMAVAGCAGGSSGKVSNQPVTLTPAPSALSAGTAAMAYDPATHNVLLVTENQGSGSETWTWNGSAWRRTAAISPPEVPEGERMAYDPVSRQLLLIWPGGAPSCPAPPPGSPAYNCRSFPPATWRWDGDQWRQLSATTPGADALAVDPVRGRLLLVGYTTGTDSSCSSGTWTWDGSTWTSSSHVPGAANAIVDGMVVDPATDHLALMEEQSHDASGLPSPGYCGGSGASLWRWDGSAWSGPSPNRGAPPGSLSLGSDPKAHDVVALTANGQTWTWDGHVWTQHHPVHAPGPRVGAAMAYDAAHERLVLFGGHQRVEGDPTVPAGDTWTWDGSDWTYVASASTGTPG